MRDLHPGVFLFPWVNLLYGINLPLFPRKNSFYRSIIIEQSWQAKAILDCSSKKALSSCRQKKIKVNCCWPRDCLAFMMHGYFPIHPYTGQVDAQQTFSTSWGNRSTHCTTRWSCVSAKAMTPKTFSIRANLSPEDSNCNYQLRSAKMSI